MARPLRLAIENARQAEALKEAHDVLETRVEERTAELSRSNAELNACAYIVAHDLRAPLRAMQGFGTALIEDYSERLDSTGIDYANHIMDSSQRMDKLIQDLLAYSRLSSDEMRIEPVNLQGVVIDAFLQLEAEVKESDAKITVKEPIAQVTGHRATL